MFCREINLMHEVVAWPGGHTDKSRVIRPSSHANGKTSTLASSIWYLNGIHMTTLAYIRRVFDPYQSFLHAFTPHGLKFRELAPFLCASLVAYQWHLRQTKFPLISFKPPFARKKANEVDESPLRCVHDRSGRR